MSRSLGEVACDELLSLVGVVHDMVRDRCAVVHGNKKPGVWPGLMLVPCPDCYGGPGATAVDKALCERMGSVARFGAVSRWSFAIMFLGI